MKKILIWFSWLFIPIFFLLLGLNIEDMFPNFTLEFPEFVFFLKVISLGISLLSSILIKRPSFDLKKKNDCSSLDSHSKSSGNSPAKKTLCFVQFITSTPFFFLCCFIILFPSVSITAYFLSSYGEIPILQWLFLSFSLLIVFFLVFLYIFFLRKIHDHVNSFLVQNKEFYSDSEEKETKLN